MRWSVFAFFAFVFLTAEASLQGVLVLRSVGNIMPSFIAALVVYLCLFAPRTQSLWACWMLGLLIDLMTEVPREGGVLGPILGPHALGYVFGGMIVLQFRSALFRRRPMTLAVMTVVFTIAASLVVVSIFAVHSWYPGESLYWAERRPLGELVRRIGGAFYSGAVALMLGTVLMWTHPAWGFQTNQYRR